MSPLFFKGIHKVVNRIRFIGFLEKIRGTFKVSAPAVRRPVWQTSELEALESRFVLSGHSIVSHPLAAAGHVAEENAEGASVKTIAAGSSASFIDADGDLFTIELKGSGFVDVQLDDPDGDGKGSIASLTLRDTTDKTSLSVAVKTRGDGLVSIGEVIGSGALKSLSAAESDLVGSGIHLGGQVGEITLHDVLNDAKISIGGGGLKLKVVADSIAPTVSGPVLGNDTGVSHSDHITSDITVTGSTSDNAQVTSLQARFGATGRFVNISGSLTADGHFALNRAQLEAVYGAALVDGTYTLQVRAGDKAGNLSEVSSLTFTVDTTGPAVVTIVPETGSVIGASDATFSVSFSEAVDASSVSPADFQVKDSTGAVLTPSQVTVADDGLSVQVSFGRLTPGQYSFIAKGGSFQDLSGVTSRAADAVSGFTVEAAPGGSPFGSGVILTGTAPIKVITADVNGDGNLDLITANSGLPTPYPAGGSISVALGHGDGTFGASVDYAFDGSPFEILTGDIDGDGDLDVVAAGYGGSSYQSHGRIAVFSNNGDGTFQRTAALEVPGERGFLSGIDLGDVDKDGDLDIVGAIQGAYIPGNGPSAQVQLFMSQADGSLVEGAAYSFEGWVTGVKVGDLDNDGNLDLVAVSSRWISGSEPYTGDQVASASVFYGTGAGTFADTAVEIGRVGNAMTTTLHLSDIDGDGDLDVLWGNHGYSGVDTKVAVVVNEGNRTFAEAAEYAVRTRVLSGIALGDVNHDGAIDILTLNRVDGVVSVLPGTGDGGFDTTSGTDYHVPIPTFSIALADVDKDGDLDLLTTRFGSHYDYDLGTTVITGSRVEVILGNHDGTFEARQLTNTGEAPKQVITADVNGDGYLDLVTANQSGDGGFEQTGSITVALGRGDGTFNAGVDYALGGFLKSIALGDIDNDGDLDIIGVGNVYGYGSGRMTPVVAVFTNKGDGTFGEKTIQVVEGLDHPATVSLADFDKDGDLDVAVAGNTYYNGSFVSILWGAGDGTLPEQSVYSVGERVSAMRAGDIDGDGDLDLILASNEYSTDPATYQGVYTTRLSVLVGNGTKSFDENPVELGVIHDAFTNVLQVADIDHDGDLDLLVGVSAYDRDGGRLAVFTNQGSGILVNAGELLTRGKVTDITLGDFNHDGDLDAVLLNGTGSVSVLFGTTAGGFDAVNAVEYHAPDARSIAVADIDQDGDLDLITTNFKIYSSYYPGYSIIKDSRFEVILGSADGDFAATKITRTGDTPSQVLMVDVDGDGDLDLITANLGQPTFYGREGSITVALGHGDGTFSTGVDYSFGGHLQEIAAGDIDGDGDIDIIAVGQTPVETPEQTGFVRVFLNDGSGDFDQTTRHDVAGVDDLRAVALGDLDGDGDLDVVVASYKQGHGYYATSTDVVVLAGAGDGSLSESGRYTQDGILSAIKLGDVDQDGDLDLIFAAERFSRLPDSYSGTWSTHASVLLGAGDGTFAGAAEEITSLAGNTGALAVADLDHDGDLDVVLAANVRNVQSYTYTVFWTGTASVILGRGDGHFEGGREFFAGNAVTDIALGDLNGDNTLDAVVIATDNKSISTFLGNGAGVLGGRTDYDIAFVKAAALADVDGDGDLDVVASSFKQFYDQYSYGAIVTDSHAQVILGDGAGKLEGVNGEAASISVGVAPLQLISADVDGDGDLDLVIANHGWQSYGPDAVPGSITVALGNGDGTFAPSVNYTLGIQVTGIALGDLDGDGDLDVVAVGGNYDYGAVSVFINNGSGSFAIVENVATVDGPLSMVQLGDIDGDGDLDVVAASSSYYDTTLFSLKGKGDATFGGIEEIAVVNTTATAIRLGDIDMDGDLDVLVAGNTASDDPDTGYAMLAGSVSALIGAGDGTFAENASVISSVPYPITTGFELVDLEGDGDLDLLVGGGSSTPQHGLSVFLNQGNGSFADPVSYFVRGSVSEIAIVDLNHDSIADVALLDGQTGVLSVLLGSESGGFDAATRSEYIVDSDAFESSSKSYITSIAIADLNHDGALDVALTGFERSYDPYSSTNTIQNSRLSVILGEGQQTA